MLFIICIITVIQAYVTPGVIPVYEKIDVTTSPIEPYFGRVYLLTVPAGIGDFTGGVGAMA